MKQPLNEQFARMQKLAGINEIKINHPHAEKRINPRDSQVADDIINHEFDTVDIVPLDNKNKIEITTSYWYRDPGVRGYSSDNSEENPGVSKVKAVLLDPSGKKISSKTFTNRFLITLGKKHYIPQIVASFKNN